MRRTRVQGTQTPESLLRQYSNAVLPPDTDKLSFPLALTSDNPADSGERRLVLERSQVREPISEAPTNISAKAEK